MKRVHGLSLLFLLSFPLWAQQQDEQLAFIGMTLADLVGRFGTPRTVMSARGNELWQDDVVFQYAEGDFYVHRDRVWQVKLASTYGVSNGDRKSVVLLALGNTATDRGDHVLLSISGKDWPLMLRVNLNSSGLVSAIYLYRSDY